VDTNNEISPARTNTAIGLISAAIIAFQLALMQILSYMQWYHFAYLIIAVALLGFGTAGTFLAVFRKILYANYHIIFPFLMIITAILMPVTVIFANSKAIRFDSLLVFHDSRHVARLIATCIIYFLPFFTGALAIGLTFLKHAGQIGKVYFSNLIGSGIGGIMAVLLLHFTQPSHQPFYIAFIALTGGLISFPRHGGKSHQITALASVIILPALFFNTPQLKPSEYKDISKTLLLPEATIEYEKSSPHGIVQIVSSPALRFAPGVSLSYTGSYPNRKAVFNNGNWVGYLVPENERQQLSILNYTPQSLPYHIQKIRKALILDAATGENIALALSHHVPVIVANEANAGIFNLAFNSFKGENSVEFHQTMARTLIASGTSSYDLIELPVIGSFFGNSGLKAIETHYELSIESLQKMWDKLSPEGMISLSCWMDYPIRNAYRLLSTIELLLKRENVSSYNEHILAVRSWSSVTFLVSKSGFNQKQIALAKQFCNRFMFDPLILPGTTAIQHGEYNLLQDISFFSNTTRLLSTGKDNFINEYPYRIQATTDNRPFFFQQIRWNGIRQAIASFEEGTVAFLEVGYLLVLLTFVLLIVIAALFIMLPLIFTPWKSRSKIWTFIYFSSLGLAYMFIEIVFIQQFTFYFGQITYATAATISFLLIASGLGSHYSASLQPHSKLPYLATILIAAILILYGFFLSPFLSLTVALPLPVKYIISIVLLGIPGFFLGIPFPVGIKYLTAEKQNDIPWAWAFNGYFSVIGTTLATIVAVETGFTWLIILAAFIYIVAGLAFIKTKALKH
jgi:hypothetical protein